MNDHQQTTGHDPDHAHDEVSVDDLTPSQRQVLATIVQVNRTAGRPLTDWVTASAEGLHKGSLRALHRRWVVRYSIDMDAAAISSRHVALAEQAHLELTRRN